MTTRGLAVLGVACALAACTEAAPAPDSLEELTAALIASPSEDLAQRRAPLWDDAVRTDPDRALASVVPAELAARWPAWIEQPLDREDEIDSYVLDTDDGEAFLFRLGDLELTLAPGLARPRHGETVHVTGYVHGDVALVTRAETPKIASLSGSQWGNQQVLGVILNFANATQTTTAAEVNAHYFTDSDSTAAYYSGVSGGAITLTGAAVGPFTVAQSATCDPLATWDAMYGALAANNVDVSPYQNLVAIIPDIVCSYNGISTLGPTTGRTSTLVVMTSGAGLLRHELGHSIGLLHAHDLTCPGGGLAADESTCVVGEYGNPVDPMGTGKGSFQLFNLDYLNLIGHTGNGTITPVSTSGTYSLPPMSGAMTGVRGLRVPYTKDTVSGYGRTFLVEYRTATGVDAALDASRLDKVYVNLTTDEEPIKNYLIATLSSGQAFTAPNGTVITVTATSASAATIAVTMPTPSGTCTRQSPLALSPEGTAVDNTFVAGTAALYHAVVRNNDSTACGPSTFTFTGSSLPAGWSIDLPGPQVILPGALYELAFRVTSPVGATGTQSITYTMTDAAVGATHTKTSGSVGYVVSSCAPVAPTISLAPATGMTIAAGGGATYLFEYQNNNPSSCGNTFISATNPAISQPGWTVSNDGAQYTIAPGATLRAAVTFTASAGAPAGTHTVGLDLLTSTGYGSGVGVYTWRQVSAQATIGTSCVRTPPLVTLTPTTQTTTTGGEKTYAVTIQNLDGANCAASQPSAFTLSATPPGGFGATFDTSSFNLAAGATGSTTLRVTPSGTPAEGSYLTTVTGGHLGQTATAVATYVMSCGAITAPNVNLAPAVLYGAPGDTRVYTASIQNPGACARTYTLTGTVNNLHGTSGWVTSVGTPSLPVAAGATGTTTLTVTAPTDIYTEYGAYQPTLTATDALGNTDSDYSIFSIMCEDAAPSISLAPAEVTSTPGGDPSFTVTVTNNDAQVCVASTFDFTQSLPGGWTGSVPASLVIAAKASASTTWTPHVNAGYGEGTYTPRLTVSDGYSATATGYVVLPCTLRAAPTVVIAPSNGITNPGVEQLYDVAVTANDAAMCVDQVYSLAATIPSGWTSSLDDPTLTINGGDTWNTDLHLTPAASATEGDYPFSVAVTSAASPSGTGNGTHTIPCTRKKALLSLAPSSQTGVPNQALAYTATITNQNIACADDTFTLSTGTVLSGWSASWSVPSVTLANGASTTATLTWTSSGTAADGSTSIQGRATNSQGTTNANATYVVMANCVRGTPVVALTPSPQSANPGVLVAYTATVTNTDSGCTNASLTLTKSGPSGWTTAIVGSTSMNLMSGASGTRTFNVTSSASASGSNTASVTATHAVTSAAGTGNATYDVICTRTNPTVALTPGSQSGNAGAALAYTATITNRDVGCGAGTFDLTSGVPSGWTGGFSATPITIAGQNATGTRTFTVTSAAGASGGTYAVTATATNPASGGAGSGSADYVLTVPCVRVAPTVVVAPSSQSALAGTALDYTVTVTNNDTGSCAAQAFALTRTIPGGWSGAYLATPLTLAVGASDSTTLTVTSAGGATPSTYGFTATATGASSPVGAGAGSYVVAAACVRHNPTVTITPSTQTGVPGTALAYTATIGNADVACGSAAIELAATGPGGWTLGVSAAQVTLGSGATTTVTLTATSDLAATDGTYAVGVGASTAASGTGSGTASYVVATTPPDAGVPDAMPPAPDAAPADDAMPAPRDATPNDDALPPDAEGPGPDAGTTEPPPGGCGCRTGEEPSLLLVLLVLGILSRGRSSGASRTGSSARGSTGST